MIHLEADLFEKYEMEVLNVQAYIFNKYGVSVTDETALAIYLEYIKRKEK